MRQFLEAAYGVKLRLKAQPARPDDAHVRTDVGLFAIEEIHLPGELEASPDPINKVAAVWATAGKVKGHSGRLSSEATPGEITLTTQPDLPYSVLRPRPAGDIASDGPVAGRGRGHGPTQQPGAAADPVPQLPAGRCARRPAVEGHRQLCEEQCAGQRHHGDAAGARSGQPAAGGGHAVDVPQHGDGRSTTPYDRTDYKPVLLARAIEFIDANAANDISLADIAEAVHVTPRAVQYMFRRHLDTTPLQYLRRVRLHHAHQELLGADRMQETVTAIAARWGFVHTGRFAVLYRQTYGQSPHTTLRG